MKIIMFLIIILAMSSLIIIESNGFNIQEKEDTNSFVSIYSDWINQVYQNSVEVTGSAVKMNWLPNSE